jgi:CMP/dCMP kinase
MKRIAIDGPAGSGKSTVAHLVAQKLGYTYLDTGAMYRAIALAVLKANVSPCDENAIAQLIKKCNLKICAETDGLNKIFLDDKDVSAEIRSQAVSNIVSDVANHKTVREVLVEKQRQMAKHGGAVLEGRDIGTVVLPEAELKIFLTASLDQRAKRRHADLVNAGENIAVKKLVQDIETRDAKDSKNTYGPLVRAQGAIEINTDNMTIEEVVDKIVSLAKVSV